MGPPSRVLHRPQEGLYRSLRVSCAHNLAHYGDAVRPGAEAVRGVIRGDPAEGNDGPR